ncbi:MAG TPA: hypothetical protein DDX54_00325 [Rhodospirillaceae bacterium]|jgi:hypothetical protein|nr:hypothetical protein [Alphaproteobacteria bacterium]HBH25840.1 hypothetical protein [Rhodospirillaceae bacterium]
MKQVKAMVYDALTPHERVVATLEAEARGDATEARRLVESCPKVTYRANDERYSGAMRAIVNLAIFLEMELRGIALAAAWAMATDSEHLPALLAKMLTLHTAWERAFAAKGLDFALVETFTAPVRNPVVAFFLDTARDIRALDAQDMEGHAAATGAPPPLPCVEPDPDETAQWQDMVEGHLRDFLGA